jgi:hypothetical protein
VVMLIANRYLEASSTGRSAGLAPQDFVDVGGGAASQVDVIRCVAHETARLNILPPSEHTGQPINGSQAP